MNPGTILLHKDFLFSDGTTKNKFLVVLGCDKDIFVVAKTTSKGHRFRSDHGCQAGNYYPAFLLTAGCCCLPLNTWICFSEFYELEAGKLRQGIGCGQIYRQGVLDHSLTRDVQFCAINCDDISSFQDALIQDSLAPAHP